MGRPAGLRAVRLIHVRPLRPVISTAAGSDVLVITPKREPLRVLRRAGHLVRVRLLIEVIG